MSVLLIGNGINQLEGVAPKWEILINRVRDSLGIVAEFCADDREISMTLGFERFILNAMKSNQKLTELDIKKQIRTELETFPLPTKWESGNCIHHLLLSLPIQHILTTNYDYLLERSTNQAFVSSATTTETIYSMRRFQRVDLGDGPKQIWHIHGELRAPRSICLGYEQYMGSVQRIRAYLTESVNKGFRLQRILAGEGDERVKEHWCHLFFTQDVHILGFGLDFSESDIWWLLNYRAKVMASSELKLRNHIYYYDTDDAPSTYKRNMLNAFGVTYESFSSGSYRDRYTNLYSSIVKSLR